MSGTVNNFPRTVAQWSILKHTMTLEQKKAMWDHELKHQRRRALAIDLARSIGAHTTIELLKIARGLTPKPSRVKSC